MHSPYHIHQIMTTL